MSVIKKSIVMLQTAQGIMATCPLCGKRDLLGADLMAVEIKDLPSHNLQVVVKTFGCKECVEAVARIYAGTGESLTFQVKMMERALELILPAVKKEKARVAREREDALKRDVDKIKKLEASANEIEAKRKKISREG